MKSRLQAFTLIELLVVISIIAILAGIALPVFSKAQEKGRQAKATEEVHGIHVGLKLWAIDHGGGFPSKKDQDEDTPAELTSANDAFANAVPAYIANESPFGMKGSRWCKDSTGADKGPDGDTSTREKVLEPGENHWAYISGLSETSNGSYPLIADGFAEGSESDPKYSKVEGEYGAVWKGSVAIVCRVDGSTAIEICTKTDQKVLRKDKKGANLFKPDTSPDSPWLAGCKVFNPATSG